MAYTAYANYVVYFANEADYQFALSALGGYNVQIAPSDIAAMFGFVSGVNYNNSGAINPVMGMYGGEYGIPAWPGVGVQVNHPGPSGAFIKSDVLSVTVPSTAGGQDMNLVWSAFITRMAGGTGSLSLGTRAPMPKRRWIHGYEFKASGEGISYTSFGYSRDSSRTVDGFGWGIRGNNSFITRTLTQYIVPTNASKSWERFYFRIRVMGTADNIEFWRSSGNPSGQAGIVLKMRTSGNIDVVNRTAAAVDTVVGTITGVTGIDQWIRLDLLIEYNGAGAGGNGRIRVYVNGISKVDVSIIPAQGGIGANSQSHASSVLGCANTPTAWEWDYDDWHNAELPNIAGVENLTCIDFLMGTHTQIMRINSGTQVNWTGQLQSLNQMTTLPEFVATSSILTSTTALAQLVGVTEANSFYERLTGLVVAEAAAMISVWSILASGSTAGRVGYSLAGAPAVMTAAVESTLGTWSTALYPGTGADILPPSIVPFTAVYEKANNAVSTNVNAMMSIVQYVGIWGFEDNAELSASLPRNTLLQNAFYPNIIQAFQGPAPDGPYCIQSGTYVGNGTTNTIALQAPAHLIWIRNVTTPAQSGVKWYATNLAGHPGCTGKAAPEYIQRVDYNITTGVSSFTVVGTNADFNANGQTYQYVAIMDPAFQFMLCGALMHPSALASINNTLINSLFTPVGAFFVFDRLDNDATIRLIYKGPGNTVNAGQDVNGVAVANCATFNTGQFTSLSGIHSPNGNQTAYSLMRTTNPCGTVGLQMYSYTGNGAGGTRVINSTPATGRFPCFVYVQPANAVGWVKDPSDIGTSSRQITIGSTSATAITAVGVDTITVGTTLNANGIVYNVFIIPGSPSSFANGTFVYPSCNPEWFYPAPSVPLPGINIVSTGGLVLDGTPPFLLMKDISGIYTLIPLKRNDTLYDRQTGVTNVDVEIPDPGISTGYIGG